MISIVLSFFEKYSIFILPYDLLLFSGERTQLDSSEVRRRLKLKGDLETECSSNRWWQVGDSGGWRRARARATRWLMGLLRECWSLLAIPAVFTWMTHVVDTNAHTHSLHARILTARGNMWTYFLSNARSFRRIFLPL